MNSQAKAMTILTPHLKTCLIKGVCLSLSSVLGTIQSPLHHSRWSQSKFGINSLVLQPYPLLTKASATASQVTGGWALQDNGLHRHLKNHCPLRGKWKSCTVLSLAPAFIVTWSGTPVSCSLQHWYCLASGCSFLNSTGMTLTPQEDRSGAQPVVTNPIEKWMPSWTGSPGCLVRATPLTCLAGVNHFFRELLGFPVITYPIQFHDIAF